MIHTNRDLLDIIKDLTNKEEQIKNIFGDCEFFSEEINDIIEIIMKQNGIKIENEIVFSKIMDFTFGEINKKKILEVLNKKYETK